MTVAVIASDSPLQQRFASAFNAEWILPAAARRHVQVRPRRRTSSVAARELAETRSTRRSSQSTARTPRWRSRMSSRRRSTRATRSTKASRRTRFGPGRCPLRRHPLARRSGRRAVRGTQAPRLPECVARSPLRVRDRCVPGRAGVRRRHALSARVRRRHRAAVARLDAPVRARRTADGVPRRPRRARRSALTMPRARAPARGPRRWPPRSWRRAA